MNYPNLQLYINLAQSGVNYHLWEPNHYVGKEITFYKRIPEGRVRGNRTQTHISRRFAIVGTGLTIIEALMEYDKLLQDKLKTGWSLRK